MFRSIRPLFGVRSHRSAYSSGKRFRPKFEPLEGRQLLAAGGMGIVIGPMALPPASLDPPSQTDDTALIEQPANRIYIEGYNDSFYGETVTLDLYTRGDANPYNDQITVDLKSQRGDMWAQFNLWKQVGGVWVRNVTQVDYNALAGRDALFNQLPLTPDVYVSFNGGDGDDFAAGGVGRETLIGAGNDDILFGNGGDDYIVGNDGIDYIDGGAGDDTLSGGAGSDQLLEGGDGFDRVFEYADVNFTLTDSLLVGAGSDPLAHIEVAELTGGAGNNTIDASAFSGQTYLYGLAGADVLVGGHGIDRLDGGMNNDVITGGAGSDIFTGGEGYDTLRETGDVNFRLTNDRLYGLGSDTHAGFEVIALTGGESANQIDASQFTSGNVQVHGLGGSDTLYGGSGMDMLDGGEGDDVIYGGSGNDFLYGKNGHDTLFGMDGDDFLNGGDDLFVDDLWGGRGDDNFYRFSFADGSIRKPFYRSDKIWDLEAGDDVWNF